MKPVVPSIAAAGVFCAALALPAEVASGPREYDLRPLLYRPHPFAGEAAPSVRPAAPAPVTNPESTPAAGPVPAVRKAPEPKASAEVAEAEQEGRPGFFSEVRVGVFDHDTGPFTSTEEEGIDANLEVLFVSPDFLDAIGSPRPHIGLTVNTSGDTSQAYLGLSWEWECWRGVFAGFSLGGAVHDGETETRDVTRKELGCRVLFRGSVELGYRFFERHGVSLFLDHISNVKLCDKNEGLENFGLRYGYRF